MIDRSLITGLVLAGGRGTRMGGLNKGLQLYDGVPLALHALRRLAPQVGTVAINANHHIDAYEAMGTPVWPDIVADHPGPLAGFVTGLECSATPWLVTVPCDSPLFPVDLVARLATAFDADPAIDIAMAATPDARGDLEAQPVFCLMRTAGLGESLLCYLQNGERKVERWTARQRTCLVRFDAMGAFANVNTPAELRRLQTDAGAAPTS